MALSPWDIVLLLAVSVMGTALSYVRAPRWKAIIFSLPVPFTLVSLSLGTPVGVYPVLGLGVLLLFTHGVRWLHRNARWPIVPAIVGPAIGYCLLSAGLIHVVPDSEAAFWTALAAMCLLSVLFYRLLPYRAEPGHRGPLPIPLKFLAIALVITVLLYIKQALQGFMSVFPMVGVITAYEARHSLWTIGRQLSTFMLAMGPLLAVVHLAQRPLGLPLALLLGWLAMMSTFIPLTRAQWRRDGVGLE